MEEKDLEKLEAGDVKIPVADGKIPAYRAVPAGAGRRPMALVVEEVFGVNDHIKDVCRRFARLGYYAVAPELFARQGDVSKIQDIAGLIPIVSRVPDSQAMADLDATIAYAEKSGRGDPARVGVTGFSWGGRIAWLYAAHNPRLKASVPWYGRLVGDTDPLHPRNPIDVVSQLHCPVLGLYGGRIQGFPSTASRRCVRPANRRARPSRSSFTRMPATVSMPITGPAITKRPPKTAGTGCSIGFRSAGADPPPGGSAIRRGALQHCYNELDDFPLPAKAGCRRSGSLPI